MLTNGHLVWLILFAPLLAAGAILLGTRRLPRVSAALSIGAGTALLLVFIITGCGSSQSQKKQSAARYTTLMRSLSNEEFAFNTNCMAQAKLEGDDPRKTPDTRDWKQIGTRLVSERRGLADIYRKYAGLLGKDTPREFLNLPFTESQQMLLEMSIAYSEWARLSEAGDQKQADEVYAARFQAANECKRRLAEWAQTFDTHGDPVLESARRTAQIEAKPLKPLSKK